MVISIGAVALSFVAGSILGCAAGYWGGWYDTIISRGLDMIMAFPLFVLAMGIVAALGNTVENVILCHRRHQHAILRPRGPRRGQYPPRGRLCAGRKTRRKLRPSRRGHAHLPQRPAVSLNMGWAVLNAAGLSFIGLGVRPPTPEWGIMVAEGANYIISGEWWLALFPGLWLMLAVFTFNLLGDGLRDIVDPRQRR